MPSFILGVNMSDTTTTEEITLADLDHYWTETGLPVFIANRDDICDIVEGMGFSIYYLIGNASKITKTTSTNPTTKQQTTTQTAVKSISLLKVVNNFVGRTVSISKDVFDNSILSIEEQALYTMPPIPHVLVEKLDQFFRLVDAQHGTESIVMLTYDTTKEGSQGWGILVPDQTNTSVHCNYDPHSVAILKPDHVMIVGSVHSHPGMSAYASGTDHKDQADFDGLHITYGWQKSVNNGATQYHIELQMAGTAYTLQPEEVFENYTIEKEPDPEVVEWSTKVKKVLPPNMGGMYMGQHNSQHPPATGTKAPATIMAPGATETTRTVKVDNQLDSFQTIRNTIKSFLHADFEDNAIFIAEIDTTADLCPCCATKLDHFIMSSGYCDFCYMPLVEKNATLNEIYQVISLYCQDLYIETNAPIYLWTVEESGAHSFMKICESFNNNIPQPQLPLYTTATNPIIVEHTLENYVEEELTDYIDEDTMYCCHTKIEENICNCTPKITAADLVGFDHETASVQVYSTKLPCQSCDHYYDISCPMYKTLIEQWVQDPSLHAQNFVNTIDGTNCDQYRPYVTQDYSYSYERD